VYTIWGIARIIIKKSKKNERNDENQKGETKMENGGAGWLYGTPDNANASGRVGFFLTPANIEKVSPRVELFLSEMEDSSDLKLTKLTKKAADMWPKVKELVAKGNKVYFWTSVEIEAIVSEGPDMIAKEITDAAEAEEVKKHAKYTESL
jgi:hypothetical protein